MASLQPQLDASLEVSPLVGGESLHVANDHREAGQAELVLDALGVARQVEPGNGSGVPEDVDGADAVGLADPGLSHRPLHNHPGALAGHGKEAGVRGDALPVGQGLELGGDAGRHGDERGLVALAEDVQPPSCRRTDDVHGPEAGARVEPVGRGAARRPGDLGLAGADDLGDAEAGIAEDLDEQGVALPLGAAAQPAGGFGHRADLVEMQVPDLGRAVIAGLPYRRGLSDGSSDYFRGLRALDGRQVSCVHTIASVVKIV